MDFHIFELDFLLQNYYSPHHFEPVPAAVVPVDADGNVLREGSGPYFVSTWREQVAKVEAKRKAAEEAAAAEAEADEES